MPRRRILNPLAQKALQDMKLEIAEEMGYFHHQLQQDRVREYEEALNKRKFEVARELGIDLKDGDNGDLRSKDAGAIGGHLGGHIGGEMVRRMVRMAQEKMEENEQGGPF